MKTKLKIMTALFLGASSTLIHAATVSVVGIDFDENDWRTSVDNDVTSGDGIYGTDGWYVGDGDTDTVKSSLPSYVTSVVQNSGGQWWSGTTSIDDPEGGPDMESGQLFSPNTDTNGTPFLTITFGSSAPDSLRIGFYRDSRTDDPGIQIRQLTLTSTGTGAGSVSLTEPGAPADTTDINSQLDFFLFDITDIGSGDTIEVHGLNQSEQVGINYGIGGVTFDAAVIPEPGSIALVGIAGLALLLFRSRSRNR